MEMVDGRNLLSCWQLPCAKCEVLCSRCCWPLHSALCKSGRRAGASTDCTADLALGACPVGCVGARSVSSTNQRALHLVRLQGINDSPLLLVTASATKSEIRGVEDGKDLNQIHSTCSSSSRVPSIVSRHSLFWHVVSRRPPTDGLMCLGIYSSHALSTSLSPLGTSPAVDATTAPRLFPSEHRLHPPVHVRSMSMPYIRFRSLTWLISNGYFKLS
jgi:hypothetical protein